MRFSSERASSIAVATPGCARAARGPVRERPNSKRTPSAKISLCRVPHRSFREACSSVRLQLGVRWKRALAPVQRATVSLRRTLFSSRYRPGALQSQSNASHIINSANRMPTTRSRATASDAWNLNSSKFIRQKAAAICSPRYESRGLEVCSNTWPFCLPDRSTTYFGDTHFSAQQIWYLLKRIGQLPASSRAGSRSSIGSIEKKI